MKVQCPVCQTEYDLEPGKYKCECGAKFFVEDPNGAAETFASSDEDPNKTIAPRHHSDFDPADDKTMPGKRDRKPDGRFEPGDLIMGRYKVLAELGQGGMGVVYKCFDETAGVEIALKALPPELSHNTLEMEDIKENFQLVHNLHHPNIASSNTLEKDNANGNYYLIMECVEGEDLRRWIKRKRRENSLTLETVLPVIRQVAEALDYAHEQKIIHRDIKPGNIMIDADGHVKVLDFGLAAQIHTSMTRVSMAYHGTSGTGPYMAPEQWRGRAQGAAADQYALAVMSYEMLAGHLPFESTDAAVLKQAVLDEKPEPLANVSRNVQTAVSLGMSKDPAERFSSCSEFVDALEGQSAHGANRKTGKGMWVALAAVILLAVIGISYGHHQSAKAQRIADEQRIAAERPQKAEEQRIAEEKRQRKQRIVKPTVINPAAVRKSREKQDSASDVVQHSTNASALDRESSNPKYLSVNILGCRYDFSRVESGSFIMGENEEAHKVFLSKPYYIGIHEITQEQWYSIMKTNPSEIQGKNHPVENMTWHEAKEFCKRLDSLLRSQLPPGYHINLPTEAQWEYAAAGAHLKTKEHRYSGSSNVDDVAWFGRNSGNTHHEVGQKSPNELGVFDMCGNVWELCLDWVGPYSKLDMVQDPTGPSMGTDRQCRGGSWRDPSDPTIKLRHWAAPNGRFPDLGFRIVLNQGSQSDKNMQPLIPFAEEKQQRKQRIISPEQIKLSSSRVRRASKKRDSAVVATSTSSISVPPRETERPTFHALRFPAFNYQHALKGNIPELPASSDVRAGILVDADTGNVLWDKQASLPVPIASMTKIMTLLLACEDIQAGRNGITLQSPVKVSSAAARIGGSQVWLDPKETFPLEELLKAVAIKGATDAAYQVAEFLGEGDVDGFVERMNRRAREIGMKHTRFHNPHGMPGKTSAEENISSPADMALLTEYCLQHDDLMKWAAMPRADFRGGKTELVNRNNLLPGRKYPAPGVDGLKTGFTKQSGYCITVTCKRGSKRLIAVVTGFDSGKNRDLFIRSLLNWGYARLENPAAANLQPNKIKNGDMRIHLPGGGRTGDGESRKRLL